MQARIADTQDTNKNSYLKAIADRIVTGTGSPGNWGALNGAPADFGLASQNSLGAYVLDADKVSRLNSQNLQALSTVELANSTKLTDIALSIQLSQVMEFNLVFISNQTEGSSTSFSFEASTSINSKPQAATIHSYIVAENTFTELVASTDQSGKGTFTATVPTNRVEDAMLVAFARAPFDERITSFCVYCFSAASAQTTPADRDFKLSTLAGELSFDSETGSVSKIYTLTYAYNHTETSIPDSPVPIPTLVDLSPKVMVACCSGTSGYLQEWTSYPMAPFSVGSSFANSERNIYSYMVTVDGILYRLTVSLGGPKS